MRLIALLPGLFCFAYTATGLADQPRCKSKELSGQMFDVCERDDITCKDLTREQLIADPSEWSRCMWPATIIKSHLILAGLLFYTTHVSIVPMYKDSERVDIKITVEQPDHTFREFVKKDIPIIIRDGIPQASMDISSKHEPLGVPTVEATEKGGKKEALPIYK